MADLSINSKTLDHYYSFLKKLDTRSKEKLITKLKASLKKESEKNDDDKTSLIFGAWEDDRSTEEIIAEIKESRVEKNALKGF